MEDKLEILDIDNNSTSILGSQTEAILKLVDEITEGDGLVAVLSVDNIPIEEESVVVDSDYTDGYKDDFDSVKSGTLNENKGVYLRKKDGLSMFVTNPNVVDKCKLYEYNSRLHDYYGINSIIINALVYPMFVNKLKTQSVSNNIAYADIVIKRIKARGSHKAYVAMSSFLYDLFLNPSKKYSLETLSLNDLAFTDAHRNYLCDAIEKIKNDPRDFSFFKEEDLDNWN